MGNGFDMTDVIAEKAKKTAKGTDQTTGFASEGTALDRRYGQIGISAVAAAARYQGDAKNPAYAPVVCDLDDRIEHAA
jgi:hypothetical protein